MGWWKNRLSKKEFVQAPLAESAAPLQNPGRGWYQVHAFDLSRAVDYDELYWCIDKTDTLALLLLDIGAWRDCDLPEEAVSRTDALLAFFAAQKKDCILRIVYDREGNGLAREPHSLEQIRRHMQQLGSVIKRHAQSILVLQGLFVGSWGEMHSSVHAAPEKLKTLAKTLWEATGGSVYLAVRTPAQWRTLCPETENLARHAAIYDDALFASATHLGTFSEQADAPADWRQKWPPAAELAFLQARFVRMPNGGEALFGELLSHEETLSVLSRMHVCYLNRVYDARRIALWKEETGDFAAPFCGADLYTYIGAHLGYRFVVRSVHIQKVREKQPQAERDYAVTVEIANTGFGNLTQEARCFFETEDETGARRRFVSASDPRLWDCRTVTTVTGEVTADAEQVYALYIGLERSCDGRLIRFANTGSETGVWLGSLLSDKKRNDL